MDGRGLNPLDDPVFGRYKFYTAKPKTKLNRKRLIRTNSIYDDGTDVDNKKQSQFVESFTALLDNITLHCYNYLVQPNRSWIEKIFWIIVHSLNAWFFCYIILNLFYDFNARPLVTSLQDTIYPIKFVPFPALAFCSNNRISKNAAQEFAKNLTKVDPLRRNESYFLESILLLGSLYDAEMESDFSLLDFQEFLEQNVLVNSSDLTNLIYHLTPTCEDLTVSCHWRNEQRSCMANTENSTALLLVRRTRYGFCCTFNYNRKDNFTASLTENRTRMDSLVTGPEMSLIVTLNASRSDSFWNFFHGPGYRVLIFDENEYPDTLSGGVVETQVLPGTETFLRIDPITIESDTNILYYGVETRGCMYPTERPSRYGGVYTRSSCILNCRIRSVVALCECVPFYLYVNTYLANAMEMPPVCTLQNVACLAKYKVKWQTVITKIMDVVGLEKEMEESLYCPECLPSCARVAYSAQSTSLPLLHQTRNNSIIPNNITDVSDLIVLRVFFGNPETWLYNQDIAQYWFEIASSFGGLFGLTAGFSIVSGLEIIYFVLWHFGSLIYRNVLHLMPRRMQKDDFIIYP